MTRKIIVPGDIDYDDAVGNPFGYLATLRSGSTKEQFDLDSINKSAHSGGGMEHVQNEVDIARTIREVVDSNMRVPRDMRIDDSGIPVAKNFYEWVTRDSFAMVNNEKPYIEQLCWGIISLNEACPKCSDLEYLYLDHNVADTYAKFARKVCLYENGVCPSCKKGRSYWIRKGKGRFIQELNVCAGQRCVVGAEVSLTTGGMYRMSELALGRPLGFSDCDVTIHNGIRAETTDKFFVAAPEPLLKATFHNGMTITGTKDHPVMTTAGFVKLSNLKEGDKVVSAIGQNMYGNGKAMSFTFHEETGVPLEVRTANREEVESYITILFSNWGRRTEFGYSVKAEGQYQKDVAAILMNMGVGVRLDDTHIHVSGIFLERLKEIIHNNMYCDFEIPDCPVEEDWYDHLTTYNVMHLRTVKVEEAPAEITYDFHVPESHRFVCSGIVNHNSGKSLSVAGYFAPYLTHRMLKLQNPSAFYNLKTGTMLHCTFVALTYAQAKDTLWQNFYSTLVESAWFCIAEHAPITMHDGSKKAIEDVREGDQVATLEGVGDVVKHKYMGEKECFEVETEDGHILPGTSDHRVRCLSECGAKLVWKTIGELTEDDHVVVEKQNVSKVLSVTPVGIRKVYDFEVKDVHNYYAGGINVHNCEYHSMLRYYSDKFGEKLLRFNDTYVAYPARGLMAYPAGPDKRVLRGRTRYFACIAGGQLVNTDEGLVPMETVTDGLTAHIGSKSGRIRNHTMTGVKEVRRLTLESGQELVATPEHKVVVYRDQKFKKVKISRLREDDEVCIGLGGSYPKDRIQLPAYRIPECLNDLAVRMFQTCKEQIDMDVVRKYMAQSDVRTRSIANILGHMRQAGAINRHYRKGKMVRGMKRCYYTLACEDTLKTFHTMTHDLKIPTEVTPELGEFIGMLLADGNTMNSGQKGIWFCSTHKERVKRFHYLSKKLFGNTNHIVGVAPYGGRQRSWNSTLCNKYIIEFLRIIGLTAAYSADKVIPDIILRSPREVVLACLRGMYLCDGREHHRHVVYNTTSKVMASQIQQLLLRESVPLRIGSRRAYDACVEKYGKGRIIRVYGLKTDTRFGKLLGDIVGIPIERVGKRRQELFGRTKDRNIVTSTIASITKEKGKVKVYDMTVGHKRHAYQASGMLVANSVDEIGWFDSNKDSNKVKDNAHEIVGALDRSLLTMRGAAERLVKEGYDDVYPGYAMNVSSPSHRNDMICMLVRKAQDSKSAYGVTRATWEVNPDLPRSSAAIEDAYRDDPQTAERDYGAVPPLASSPLISSEKQIEGVLTGRPNLLNIKRTVKRKQKLGESFTLAKIAKSKGFKKPTIMAIDAGYTNNSFSGVIGHVNDEEQAVVKALFEIIPARGAPLNHSLIFTDLLIPAMRKYNVRILLADRWNSIKLLQDAALEMDLAVAKQHSLKYPQLFNVKTRVQQGSLILPVPERGSLQECLTFEAADYPECFDMQPASHLAMQLATVKDTGRTVDKGDGYTDDIFRSLALFVWASEVEEFRIELEDSPDDEEVLERPTAFAVSGLLSGGGGQWGGGGSNTPSDGIGFVGGYLPNKR